MCNSTGLHFGYKSLTSAEVQGKDVIDVGAMDINGSLRSYCLDLGPRSYLGVDIEDGSCVDEVVSVYNLESRFGQESFDVVISTEMLEHVCGWREAITNLKRVLKVGGVMILTTRSKGFGYHAYPTDHWRYELSDMRNIFEDMDILALEADAPVEPGVFIKVRKPDNYVEKDLSNIHLYHVREDE